MINPERSAPRRDVPIARQVINVIADRLSVDPDSVKESLTLVGDLRADSLDVAELGMDIEDAFGLPTRWEEDMPGNFSASTTVGDVISYIKKEQEAQRVKTIIDWAKAAVVDLVRTPSQDTAESELDQELKQNTGIKTAASAVTDTELLLELFKRKHLLERLKNDVFNRP